MAKHTIPQRLYEDAVDVFHWAYKRHFQLWFLGESHTRHRRTESVLRRLVLNGRVRAVRYGNALIYSLSKKVKNDFEGLSKVVHGVACTEGLVRVYRSKVDGEVIAERFFYGLGAVPEWGIRYPNKKMILFEFSTKHNFYFAGNMRSKLQAYRKNLEKIERKFQSSAIVLFVLDIPRSAVERYVGSIGGSTPPLPEGDTFPLDPFYFVDYETFLKQEIGKQLQAPIYFYMDGKEYSL